MDDASDPTEPARGQQGKSAAAFRTISEVAEELDVPQHVLRFWESKFNQIRPMKRGGGRRYYRPEDVRLLRRIRHLLYTDGFTIRGVQRLLRENGVRAVVEGAVSAAAAVAAEDRAQDDPVAPDESGMLTAVQMPVIAPEIAETASDNRPELEAILAELVELRAFLTQRLD
ncbi:MAG: MerR family transcriptional regulator [Alphaproteobacteria bacterium]